MGSQCSRSWCSRCGYRIGSVLVHHWAFCAFCAFSCSIICLLQLFTASAYRQKKHLKAHVVGRFHKYLSSLPFAPSSSLQGMNSEHTYFRLGKNTSGGGIFSLCSLSAETFHARAVNAAITTPMIAVLDFQFLGWAYHPPAGDQTCFG